MASTDFNETTVLEATLVELTPILVYFDCGEQKRVMKTSDIGFKLIQEKFHNTPLPVKFYFVVHSFKNSLTIKIFNETEFKQSEYFGIQSINDFYI